MDKTDFLTIFPTFENLEIVKKTLPTIIEETKATNSKLIVHDSSVDNRSAKWEYLENLNRNRDFFLLLSTNLSLAHARNMCIKLGQELYAPDYICVLEDDHGFMPGVIDALKKAMTKFYGRYSPNGLRYGMFTACYEHTNAHLEHFNHEYDFPGKDNNPLNLGGFNNCFRCAPANHWNNVLKYYDTDEYLISIYQTVNIRLRNYHKGFTVLFVGNGSLAFSVEGEGRGMSNTNEVKLWDNQYAASDIRSMSVKGEENISISQKRVYQKSWDDYKWNGERLFPVMLPLEEILSGSTASLNTRTKPKLYNVMGTPRSGTKWMQKIMTLLLEGDTKNHSIRKRSGKVGHFHEGIIEDFNESQCVIFIHRDIRDCIVSGYFYLLNDLHEGTMGCNSDFFRKLSTEDGIREQLIMYMKYRMPVYDYWYRRKENNVLKVKYENLLIDLEGELKKISDILNFQIQNEEMDRICEIVNFKHMYDGRERGEEDQHSHPGKSISGDWKNHFTEEHKQFFRDMGGEDFLLSVGYEL